MKGYSINPYWSMVVVMPGFNPLVVGKPLICVLADIALANQSYKNAKYQDIS